MTELIDGLAALTEQLAVKRSGWHRVEHPETGATAYFPSVPNHTAGSPEQLKLEEKWEKKALAQNAESERLERASRLEAKPLENSLAERKARIVRGD